MGRRFGYQPYARDGQPTLRQYWGNISCLLCTCIWFKQQETTLCAARLAPAPFSLCVKARLAPAPFLFCVQHASHLYHTRSVGSTPRTWTILALCAARLAPTPYSLCVQHDSHLHHSRMCAARLTPVPFSFCRQPASRLNHSSSVCSTPRTCTILVLCTVRLAPASFSLCVQHAPHLHNSRSLRSTPRTCTLLILCAENPRTCTIFALCAARLAPAPFSLLVQHASNLHYSRSVCSKLRTCTILARCTALLAPAPFSLSVQHASHLYHFRSLCRKSLHLHHSRSVCSTPRTYPFLAPSAARLKLALFSLCEQQASHLYPFSLGVQQASHLYHSRSVYSTPRTCTPLALSAALLAPATFSFCAARLASEPLSLSVQHASHPSRSVCSTLCVTSGLSLHIYDGQPNTNCIKACFSSVIARGFLCLCISPQIELPVIDNIRGSPRQM